MNTEVFEKIKAIRGITIKHPQFEKAVRKIERAFLSCSECSVPENLICIGPSGTGKSTLKNWFVDRYDRKDVNGCLNIPILAIDTPSHPTVKNFAEAVLIELGDPNYSRGSMQDKTNRIQLYLRQCEVKLIIFDELQHFVDQGTKSAQRSVSDWLKLLIDKSGVSTVLMGLERSERILQENEQIRRRFSHRVDLTPFSIDTQEDKKTFYGAIFVLDKSIALPKRIEVDDNLLISFFYATNGVMGYLVKLMLGAFEEAYFSRSKSISRKHLEVAFTDTIWSKGVGSNNPFSSSFAKRPLIREGMPFYLESQPFIKEPNDA